MGEQGFERRYGNVYVSHLKPVYHCNNLINYAKRAGWQQGAQGLKNQNCFIELLNFFF